MVSRHVPADVLSPLDGNDLVVWPRQTAMPDAEFMRELAGSDLVISFLTDRLDGPALDGAPRLRAVSQVAVGLDNVAVEVCTGRGIPVGHTPDVLTETTADTAWALLTAAVRRVPEGRDLVLAGEWGEWRPDLLLGGDLYGTTVGIVGLGRIGAAVARRAAGFSMRVLYTGPHRKPHLEPELKASYRDLTSLLTESDHVMVTAPLTPATRGLIGAEALAAMKPDAVLVNVSRGPLVDTEALLAALRAGRPGAVALDVTDPEPLPGDHPLLGFPNVLVIPHLGSASVRTRRRMVELAVTNAAAAVHGWRMPACVNPSVYASASG